MTAVLFSCSNDSNNVGTKDGSGNGPSNKGTTLPNIQSCDSPLKSKKLCADDFGVGGHLLSVVKLSSDCTFQLSRVFDDGESFKYSGVWYDSNENGTNYLSYFDAERGAYKQAYKFTSSTTVKFEIGIIGSDSRGNGLLGVVRDYRICN